MAKEIAEEYASSLADLTINSKPLINMLTILAEENIEHAGVIVETVEKHLEKVSSDIKLPVLYLVDSIIKNVGGAYIQKFAQSIVNMFTKTFKQVDEKTRSQMFKLRETWHEVFPSTKLYQLDVKVNLIDPAWPIQSQPHPSIHPAATSSTVVDPPSEEQMKSILAKKEQELLRLQRKKIEMELEQTRRQLELAEKTTLNQMPQLPVVVTAGSYPTSMPVAMVNPVMAPQTVTDPVPPVKARLGPQVTKSGATARIAPASGAMIAAARRDPRLQRPPQQPPIAPHVFDIKPLDRVTKRKNVITIDVTPQEPDKEIKSRDPRRRDPRMNENKSKDIDERRREKRREFEKKREERKRDEDRRKNDEATKTNDVNKSDEAAIKTQVDDYMTKLQIPDPKKINKLPPIPKISRHEDRKEDVSPSPTKRRKEIAKSDKKGKNRDSSSSKDSSDSQSPDKRVRNKDAKKKTKSQPMEVDDKAEQDVVAFKELKNYNKERYRRNRDKSESPEKVSETTKSDDTTSEISPSNVPEVVDTKDVDLRVLPGVEKEVPAGAILQKRPSTESAEVKPKKSKLEKFDILFGSEDVDLRQLPQVEESTATNNHKEASPKSPKSDLKNEEIHKSSPKRDSPTRSPRKDWNDVKEKSEEPKKTPTKLDLVRAKLAEATKGKDRLGRPLLFSKSPSIEREKRISITEDVDLRVEPDDDVNKETISLILSQAMEHFKDGKMDKNQYNTLMFQVMQLNEKLKLKEAKQRESLEMSKRKLIRVHKSEVDSPKSSPGTREHNRFGDIDERVPPSFVDTPPDSQDVGKLDSDMRFQVKMEGPGMLPHPPMPMFMMPGPMGSAPIGGPMGPGPLGPTGPMSRLGPMRPLGPPVSMPTSMGPNMPMPPNGPMPNGQMPPMGPMSTSGPFPPMWRGRPRAETFRGQLPVASATPFFRGPFEKHAPRPQFEFDARFGPPMPKIGMGQGERPYPPYKRANSPPPLGTPGIKIPPTDLRVIDYIDQDPMKTIDIDGVAREIRFYGETAIVMLDWDDPREIRFLPGSRRINFDNKDSVVLNLNDGYKQVEIDDQVFNIRYGAPTRELYINGKWYECFFGSPPTPVIIEGKNRIIQLEGPAPQVDIAKERRSDLVAGKINLIVDAQQMCPIFLDAKIQKFTIDGKFYTIRFVDALKTVLINEQPFIVEFGGLPRPIYVGDTKHFVRFSVVPRHVKPGQCEIVGMEGVLVKQEMKPVLPIPKPFGDVMAMEVDVGSSPRPEKALSPEGENSNHGGLDMLASLMPTSMAPASTNTGYSAAEPASTKPDKIPGLDPAQPDTTPGTGNVTLPMLGNINVNDLFAKLVATGIVHVQKEDGDKGKAKVDKNVVHKVDLLKSETLRIKQPALITKLYNGMQCSGCGTRFPPEQTVKYSQHLDWHFRQNRRERDSARRAHSRHWHYDLSDWVQYEEVEDLEEREKSWFETGGAETEGEQPTEVPEETLCVPSGAPTEQFCALCGDKFDQFYNEDKEEWHLRKAVNYEDKTYHPMCFEDYKASQSKLELEAAAAEAAAADQSVVEIPALDKTDEPIEITDFDDFNSHSDNESDVEVLENKKEEIQEILDDPPEEPTEPTEAPPPAAASSPAPATSPAPAPLPAPAASPEAISEESGDEDDVVLKADPIVEVTVDECDTDDETTATRKERDVDFAKVKIKQEPIDPDDEPVITSEEQAVRAKADATDTTVLSSIDGNVHFDSAQRSSLPAAPIRINISKSIPTFLSTPLQPISDKSIEEMSTDDEPLPPGEEIEIEYKLKPALQDVELSRQPPVQRGTELSGLCSIM